MTGPIDPTFVSALGDQAPRVSAWERRRAGCSVQAAILGVLRPSGSSWFLARVGRRGRSYQHSSPSGPSP